GKVEVQTALAIANLASGDLAWDHGAQQVQAAVHAHQAMSALPVDLGRYFGPNLGQRGARCHDMDDLVRRYSLHGVDDGHAASIRQAQDRDVARLSTAHRIKNRRIEANAPVIDGSDLRRTAARIGIVSEEELHDAPWKPICARCYRARRPRSRCAVIVPLASK